LRELSDDCGVKLLYILDLRNMGYSLLWKERLNRLELKELLVIIEELRNKLHKISEGKTLTDPEVIAASNMLDAVLNEYQKLMNNKTNCS